ncbi:MAG: DUF4255 domain-containing protein [Lachnospiraceae bacterium]|nr:DUF4255 domain-containing protein [Lachnospiraceae bacterium]
MADYTVISDVGNALVSVLRENMVPDVILNPESIGLCSPEEKGDMVLGVCLYDVRESEEYRYSGMVSDDVSHQKYPSMYLSLHYMVTAYSNGDVKFRASEEQKILGKALQVLADYSILDPVTYQPMEQSGPGGIQIMLQSIPQEDKLKLWTVPNKAYHLSLFLKVGPVELESAKIKQVQRVVDVEYLVKE